MSRSSRTLYVGNLPGDIREREVEKLFDKYGPVVQIDLKIPPRPPGYAFVEFEDPRDAEDAIRYRDGYDLDGHRLRVELAHGGRGRSSSDRHSSHGGGGGGGGVRGRGVSKRTEYRVMVTGLPTSASWQDLKDHMRKAGDVCFSQVFREGGGTKGVVDYTNYDDMKYAVSLRKNTWQAVFMVIGFYVKSPKAKSSRRSRSRSVSRSRSRSKPRSLSRYRCGYLQQTWGMDIKILRGDMFQLPAILFSCGGMLSPSRARSPLPARQKLSKSPKKRSFSRSPSRSPSRSRGRNLTPRKRSVSRSPSPRKHSVSRSPSPSKNRGRNVSPRKHSVSRSPSPGKSRGRNLSPKKRSVSRSRSPGKSRGRNLSPKKRSVSRSPSPSKSRGRSISPTRSMSRSPSRHNMEAGNEGTICQLG
ncbi:hypothetical protein ACFE04_018368 [Oxalis oulophora]